MKKIKVSFILNILIVVFVFIMSILMFYGIKFMPQDNIGYAAKFEMFKFYTTDSNILLAICSLILLIYEYKYINKKITSIPNWAYIIKLIGVCCISLTFMTTLVFLTPKFGIYAMYNNSSLFFHLIVPMLSFISYIGYENHDTKYKYALLGIIPMFIYSIYYTGNILLHLDNIRQYDLYGFLNGNINNMIYVLPIMYSSIYLMSIFIIYLNKKIASKE